MSQSRSQFTARLFSAGVVLSGLLTTIPATRRAQERRLEYLEDGRNVDWPARNVAIFGALLPVLPRTGVVGYLERNLERETLSRSSYFNLAQFALAPLVLEPVTDHALVVVNFQSDEEMMAAVAGRGWRVVEHVGPGLAVFQSASAESSEPSHN